MEIATADDRNEPIHVRQYQGQFATIVRTLTLLDANGNTSIPGDLHLQNPETIRGVRTVLETSGGRNRDSVDLFTRGSENTLNNPIYATQYLHTTWMQQNRLTLLDTEGNTHIPKNLSVGGSLHVSGVHIGLLIHNEHH